MKLKNINQCPCCRAKNITPLPLITFRQAAVTGMKDYVSIDIKLENQLYKINGYIPDDDMLKQMVIDEENIKDRRYKTESGYPEINQYACPECHSNISALLNEEVKEVRIVPLIGAAGTSKTATITSIVKLIIEKPYKGNDQIRLATPVSGYEYLYYLERSRRYPEIPKPTVYMHGHLCTQPLCYILVNNVLLVFADNPGETYEFGGYPVMENTIPLYLYDISKGESNNYFLNHAVNLFHENGRKYEHEVVAVVKSDVADEKLKKSIMLTGTENTGKPFESLYMARKTRMEAIKDVIDIPIYNELRKNYCDNTDLVCFSALGTDVWIEEDRYILKNEWSPEYLYDLLLTLAM